MKVPIYQTVVRPTLLYGCETWQMLAKDEQRMPATYKDGAMGNGCEPAATSDILEEAKVEPIAMVMSRRRLNWFGHMARRDENENIRSVAKMQMEGRALEEDQGWDGHTLPQEIWQPGRQWKNGPLAEREKERCICKTRNGGERWKRREQFAETTVSAASECLRPVSYWLFVQHDTRRVANKVNVWFYIA